MHKLFPRNVPRSGIVTVSYAFTQVTNFSASSSPQSRCSSQPIFSACFATYPSGVFELAPELLEFPLSLEEVDGAVPRRPAVGVLGPDGDGAAALHRPLHLRHQTLLVPQQLAVPHLTVTPARSTAASASAPAGIGSERC